MNPWLSVRARLLGLCLGLLVVLGGANLYLGKIIRDREPQEVEQQAQYHRVQTMHAAKQAINTYRYWQGQANSAVLIKNPQLESQAKANLNEAWSELVRRLGEVEKFDRNSAQIIRETLDALPGEMAKVIEAIAADRKVEADQFFPRVRKRLETIEETLNGAIAREQADAEAVERQQTRRAADAVTVAAVILVASAAIGVILTLLVLRSIIRPLRTTVSAIRQVNAGETSLDLPPVSQDEFGDIAVALRQFRDQAERLRRMAYNDPLTGLGNRACAEDELRGAIESCKKTRAQLAILYIDLDNFRSVNDSLGHTAGDRYLCEAALRLQRFAPPEALVCRYSGDKFTVLIEDLDPEEVPANPRASAEVILRGMAEPYQLADHLLPMSVSIGVAVYPSDGETGEQLLSSADAAMYRAKQGGRNKAQFATPELTADVRKQLTVAADIRRGLEHAEFEPYYQPVIDVDSGKVVSAEALLRWVHPVRGLVQAGDFIPTAEASGLIHALGERCLQRASEQVVRWAEAARPIRVSVNLSPRQIDDGSAIRLLERMHADSGHRPSLLDFEITETAMLERGEHTQQTLQRVRAMGHRLGVDDFGTGYSSLVYLQRFPLDRIKIDRSFVARVETSREARAIISATVALARSLDMEVIGEGVETEAQMNALRHLGCTLQQGFLFTPALPAGELETWIDARTGVTKSQAAVA